jgi:UDP-N-acetylmuramate: L-alanyl-gamma-D-glutamyl-meso-diaminopimelate ligase
MYQASIRTNCILSTAQNVKPFRVDFSKTCYPTKILLCLLLIFFPIKNIAYKEEVNQMDLKMNKIPINPRKIHLTAICGTAMGALACMLKEMGYEVTGSDQKTYPPISTFLVRKGIKIIEGYSETNLSHEPDLVIIGNAIRKDNPEVLTVIERGIPFCSMPQAINHFAAFGKKILLVTGTHGKTTTASLLAWVLFHAGLDPSYMIGGIVKNFDSNFRYGKGDYIVIEGDEYDTAFFDKGPKFSHYSPDIAILTSVEFDHADIFSDIDHVCRIFKSLIDTLPADSTLIAFDADTNIDRLIPPRSEKILRYGSRPQSAWRLDNISFGTKDIEFDVIQKGQPVERFTTFLPGQHNLYNTLSVIAVAAQIGISKQVIAEGILQFNGVKRRQEIRGVKRGVTVMDDFAHHPTAVRETLRAVKPFYRSGRILAVFEPRTNSSMRNIFQDIYPNSFDEADLICIRQPPMLEKIPPAERFSSEKLVIDLKAKGKSAYFFPDTDSIIPFLISEASSGDLILIMSNGGFDNIHERLLERL